MFVSKMQQERSTRNSETNGSYDRIEQLNHPKTMTDAVCNHKRKKKSKRSEKDKRTSRSKSISTSTPRPFERKRISNDYGASCSDLSDMKLDNSISSISFRLYGSSPCNMYAEDSSISLRLCGYTDGEAAVKIQSIARCYLQRTKYRILTLKNKLDATEKRRNYDLQQIESKKLRIMHQYEELQGYKPTESDSGKPYNHDIAQLKKQNGKLTERIQLLTTACTKLTAKNEVLESKAKHSENAHALFIREREKVLQATKTKLESNISKYEESIRKTRESFEHALVAYKKESKMKKVYIRCLTETIILIQERDPMNSKLLQDIITRVGKVRAADCSKKFHPAAGVFSADQKEAAVTRIQAFVREHLQFKKLPHRKASRAKNCSSESKSIQSMEKSNDANSGVGNFSDSEASTSRSRRPTQSLSPQSTCHSQSTNRSRARKSSRPSTKNNDDGSVTSRELSPAERKRSSSVASQASCHSQATNRSRARKSSRNPTKNNDDGSVISRERSPAERRRSSSVASQASCHSQSTKRSRARKSSRTSTKKNDDGSVNSRERSPAERRRPSSVDSYSSIEYLNDSMSTAGRSRSSIEYLNDSMSTAAGRSRSSISSFIYFDKDDLDLEHHKNFEDENKSISSRSNCSASSCKSSSSSKSKKRRPKSSSKKEKVICVATNEKLLASPEPDKKHISSTYSNENHMSPTTPDKHLPKRTPSRKASNHRTSRKKDVGPEPGRPLPNLVDALPKLDAGSSRDKKAGCKSVSGKSVDLKSVQNKSRRASVRKAALSSSISANAAKSGAATKIQAIVRGWLNRIHYKKMKLESDVSPTLEKSVASFPSMSDSFFSVYTGDLQHNSETDDGDDLAEDDLRKKKKKKEKKRRGSSIFSSLFEKVERLNCHNKLDSTKLRDDVAKDKMGTTVSTEDVDGSCLIIKNSDSMSDISCNNDSKSSIGKFADSSDSLRLDDSKQSLNFGRNGSNDYAELNDSMASLDLDDLKESKSFSISSLVTPMSKRVSTKKKKSRQGSKSLDTSLPKLENDVGSSKSQDSGLSSRSKKDLKSLNCNASITSTSETVKQ